MTAVFVLRRSQASIARLSVEVWSSISTLARLTLDDKCAVRRSSASLRRLVNATTTKVRPALSGAALPVLRPGQHPLLFSTRLFMPLNCLKPMSLQAKLDLADKRQRSTLPPGLRPYVERVHVRATTYKQLEALSKKLSGVPSAAALELELSFGKHEDLRLEWVRTRIQKAGLTERLCAVKYCCRSVQGTDLFPGLEVPVSAELWPRYRDDQPATLWRDLVDHCLVELQIRVDDPMQALHGLRYALRCRGRVRDTLRCLQMDYTNTGSLPMCSFTAFLVGLKLPCLEHLGSNAGVAQPFQSMTGWPQKEDVPMLQSFGGTREPDGIFGLDRSGVHMCLVGVDNVLADMAAMAKSALGPAIRELHVTVEDFKATWEGIPAALPFRSVLGFLAMFKSVKHLSLIGWEGNQLLVRADAINALDGLQKLALKDVTLEGDLNGPCLSEIVCASLQTQLLTVLARPPPALASALVPYKLNAVVPHAVLGIDVPWCTTVVRACPGGPCWKVMHEACSFQMHRRVHGLVRAVPCRD